MIIVRLEGGLGNQMFQYAIGKHLSVINKTKLKLDLSSYEKKLFDNGAVWRGYNLDVFDLNLKIASDEEIENTKNSRISFFEALKYKLQRLHTIPYFRKSELFEDTLFYFDKNILKAPENCYLTGYWQSHKYFDSIRTTLLNDFRFKQLPSNQDYSFITDITTRESISIHIRRGDYITHAETNNLHGVCSVQYYQKAIEYISSKIKDPLFVIFSDDIDWAEVNIKTGFPSLYIKGTPPGKDYFEMYLMSNCKHNIIANSSFSWWGAWLNENHGKMIIAPKKWMNIPGANFDDLMPENWVRL